MQQIPVTRVTTVARFTGWMRDKGIPVDRALERFDLPLDDEPGLDVFWPVPWTIEMFEAVKRREGIDDLVFSSFSDSLKKYDYSDEEDYFQTQGDLFRCVTHFFSLRNISVSRINFTTLFDEKHMKIFIDSRRSNVLRNYYWYDYTLILQIAMIFRNYIGVNWSPSMVALQGQFDPCDGFRMQFQNTEIRSNAPVTCIAIDLEQLRGAKQTLKSLTAEKTAAFSVSDQLRIAVSGYVSNRYPSIDLAAEMLGTSKRSLQRSLYEEGTTYARLVRGVRVGLAQDMLARSDDPIVHIAGQVGYTDHTHFTRAFRQVFGLTPTDYRRIHQLKH